MLEQLQTDHPVVSNNNVNHYQKASLWAQANAFAATISHKDMLLNLVSKKPALLNTPYLKAVDYTQVSVAKAHYTNNALELVLYPLNQPVETLITLAGLKPESTYVFQEERFNSDTSGEATIRLSITKRTEVIIRAVG